MSYTFKPGDILRVAPRRFVLVVYTEHEPDNGPSGFYYARCRMDGTLIKRWGDTCSAANYINHSNMFIGGGRRLQLVGHIELDNRSRNIDGRVFKSWRTGDTAIDQYMGNLDDRYRAFSEHAGPEFKQAYARNENENFHSENGALVTAWFDGIPAPKRQSGIRLVAS